MRVVLLVVAVFIFNASYSQNYSIEEQVLNCIYDSGKEVGLDLETEFLEFKKYLINEEVLSNDIGDSYFQIYQGIASKGRVSNYFEYFLIDTLILHAKEFEFGFLELQNIQANCIASARNVDSIAYTESKLNRLSIAMDSLQKLGNIHLGVIARVITNILTPLDFEHDYYKMVTMLALAMTADVVSYKKEDVIIPNHALHIVLDSKNRILVNREVVNLEDVSGLVFNYEKRYKDLSCICLKSSGYSAYRIYLRIQDKISNAITRLRMEKSKNNYGKKYEELDSLHKELIKEGFPIRIVELE